MTDMTLRN